ncbi:MAG: D-glycero-beta-D-manno-heptose 1,7-bisphosphate 7-phosphatase [Pseudomonadota bacterium]
MSSQDLKLVLLDRDGVINVDSPDFIKHPDEWQALPGALAAIAQMQRYFKVAICSNQSGVGRGLFSEEILAAIHTKLNDELCAVEGNRLPVFYCPHHPDDVCPCRKPQPALLLTAMRSFGCTPGETVYIGDSAKDLQAAANAGCDARLVLTGNGQTTLASAAAHGVTHYADLAEAATQLVSA